jgi:hypothetical protein
MSKSKKPNLYNFRKDQICSKFYFPKITILNKTKFSPSKIIKKLFLFKIRLCSNSKIKKLYKIKIKLNLTFKSLIPI